MGRETDLFMERNAQLSACGRYRFSLCRRWDWQRGQCLYVMLNPSTADAFEDDATIRSCIRLAKSYGLGAIEVVNLFAWRATDPKNLPAKPSDAIGPGNHTAIETALERSEKVICAWGAHPYAARSAPAVLDLIGLYKPVAYCLGKTKAGAPKHPLYIKTGTPLEVFASFPSLQLDEIANA